MIMHRLERKFGDAIVCTQNHLGQETAVVSEAKLVAIATFLRDDPELQFDMPIDCTAIDWLGKRAPRFDVVYQLYSLPLGHRFRLKVHVADEHPTCPSLTPVWPGMNWHERETWDMYGIYFKGHPDMRRVLMYESFEGYPLRKDYPIDKRQPIMPMRSVGDIPTQRNPPADMLNRP